MDEFFAANNGMSISAQRFALALRRRGNEVRVLSGNVWGDPDFPLTEYRIPFFDALIKKQGMTFARADDAVIRAAVCWADVVYLENCFVVAAHAARIAKELGKPCTGAFHLYPENITSSLHLSHAELVNDSIMLGFRDKVYCMCSHIHCPTQDVADRLVEYGYKARLHVISNGVTDDFVFRREEKPDRYAGRFVLLMTGRYSVEKRQDVLIEAVKRSAFRDRIHVIFAGQGPLEDKYRHMARALPGGAEFRFLTKEQLMDVMAISDLYIHCADAEVEGMSCLEAMAGGLVPVIADSPKSSTRRFALDERSLFPAGDSRALASRMDYWLSHEAERRAMETRYSEHTRAFTVDALSAQLEAMFAAAMGTDA